MTRVFESEVRVIYGDTDAMGVAYNGNYIRWFEVGRNELMRQLGYTYRRMEDDGAFLPVAEVFCKFRLPAKYDDLLVIKATINEIKASTIVIGYEIVKKETGEVCATGWTKHAVTDENMKPINFKKANPDLHKLVADSM